MWTLEAGKDYEQVIEEVERQGDRGAAIVAAAFLEDRLGTAIKMRLKDDPIVIKRMPSGTGPLATFSAKIDFAYLLDLFNNAFREWAHTVRKIRNAFAHNMISMDFETQQIRDLCSNFPEPSSLRTFSEGEAIQQADEKNKKFRRDFRICAF